MLSQVPFTAIMELPCLPTAIDRYLSATENCETQAEIREATKPFIEYEYKLREIYAQYPEHSAAKKNYLLPLFNTGNKTPLVRARDPSAEPEEVRDRYLLSLPAKMRLANGAPAIVGSLSDFKTNFKYVRCHK